MALLELKGFGVRHRAVQVAGLDLTVEAGSMLAVVGRGDGAVSLLALALAGLLPRGAVTTGTLNFAGKRVLYLDGNADAAAVTGDAELIVAEEPGRERDPATQLALLKALQDASRTAAVLIFTADFRLALSMGLEVAVIAGGKLLLRASASQIFELPQYDTVRHLVGGERLRTRTLMRPPIGEPMLELDGVAKSYRRGLPRLGPPPVEALKGVSFAVRQGEVVGLLGPRGAGKSTLLRLVAGLETPGAGRIARRPGLVGYVFADPRQAFNPSLPVGVSLTEPLRMEETLLVEEQADRLVDAVRAVGLEPDMLTRLPGAFGVADLQRMGLARALVGRPSLLLLDDPTACLDPAEAREFLLYLARVRSDFGLTAIIASRDFEVVRAVSDRLLVIEAGHIIEGGKPAELSEAPKQELTRRLVSARYPGPARPEVRAETEVAAVAVAGAEAVAPGAPSTSFAGPPPPLHGGGSPTDSGAEDKATLPEVAAEPEPAVEPVASPAGVDAPATSYAGPPPPLHGGGPPTDSVVEEKPASPEPEPTSPPVHELSAAIVIAPVVLAEPVPVAAAPEAATEAVPVAAAPEAAGAEPAVTVVPAASGEGADEGAEGGKGEDAAGGLVDAAGGADAPDDKAGR